LEFENKQKTFSKIRDESDLSLEVVLLIILGIFMFLFGIVLFKIHTGELPYSPDSTYGLFLVIVSFQIITMGKTPFGDLRRSWLLILIGIFMAIFGMVSCFIPGFLTEIVRIFVGIILLVGGISLLIQLFTSKQKARTWMKNPGLLKQLTIACGIVYGITIILGLITLLPSITTDPQTAVFLMIYGISIFYLAWCIQKVARLYFSPEIGNASLEEEESNDEVSRKPSKVLKNASLPLTPAMLIMMGVLITLLGFLLILVARSILTFSADGELGLLMVIIAINIMTLGETPIGPYKRSWLLILIGIIFASFGIFSCIVPGILTGVIYFLIAFLNIAGGIIAIVTTFYAISSAKKKPPEEEVVIPSVIGKLVFTKILLSIGNIAFGLSMLLIGVIPAIIIGGILVVYGLLFFILASLFQKMTKMEKNGELKIENP
jgi:uncharacterized membrane protein HdeD (DUF308 family)